MSENRKMLDVAMELVASAASPQEQLILSICAPYLVSLRSILSDGDRFHYRIQLIKLALYKGLKHDDFEISYTGNGDRSDLIVKVHDKMGVSIYRIKVP